MIEENKEEIVEKSAKIKKSLNKKDQLIKILEEKNSRLMKQIKTIEKMMALSKANEEEKSIESKKRA